MKIYRNERLGFEIKHSDFYQIVNETSNSVSWGQKAINGFITYLTISTNQITDYKSYKPCKYGDEAYKQTFPCLESGERWGQNGDIVETKLGDINAQSFYIAEGLPDATYHIVQTKGSPKIEAKMFVSGGGLDSSFKRMLSTFRALDNM